MNKLTKQQAEWLIEKIRNEEDKYTMGCQKCNTRLSIPSVVHVINQCTEKEFPDIDMAWNRFGIDEALYIQQMGDEPYNILLGSKNMSTYFNKEEFKTFTDGCNKIVDWLEEQEK